MTVGIKSSYDLAKLRGPAIASYNIRSLINKVDDIKVLLSRSDLNCLILTESWLNNSIVNEELQVPRYNLFRRDRNAGIPKKGGGGIIVYCDNKYHFEEMEDWHVCNTDIEIMWIRLNLKLTKPTYIGAIYRPPDGNYDNFATVIEQKVIDIQQLGECDIPIITIETNFNGK